MKHVLGLQLERADGLCVAHTLFVAMLSCLIAGCHDASGTGDAVDGGPCAFSNACEADDSQLKSCVALASGVYGTQTVNVVERPGPGVTNGPRCSSMFHINVFVENGSDSGPPFPGQSGDAGPYVEVAVSSQDGYYSASLDAGSYWLCCSWDPHDPTCSALSIAAGEVVRYDMSGSDSVGGTPCAFTKR